MRKLTLLLVILGGCKDKVTEPAKPPGELRAADDVKPAFEGNPREVKSEVAALCEALHQMPAERKAACCKAAGTAVHFGGECARVLSLALEAGTVQLKDPTPCVTALIRSHQGCGWVGPNEQPLPTECLNLLVGRLPQGAKCRSTFECVAGARCAGAGPTATGVCASPGRDGLSCELSVDVLATYVRQPVPPHLECSGFCQRHRCEAVLTDGGACTLDAQCPAGQRCGGSCIDGERGAAGEKCVPGGCANALRCVAGVCAAPKAEGEACAADLDCVGACVGSADAGRRCGAGC